VAASCPPSIDQPAAVLVRLGPGGPLVADPGAPFLAADDLGVLRGDGIFERFLVRAGQPRHLDDHLSRLARSAAMTELMAPGRADWEAAIGVALQAWSGPDEWAMRLVCTRGPEGGGPSTAYVLGQELNPAVMRQRRDGVAAITIERGLPSGLTVEAPWLLLGAKTLSYAVNMAVQRWAKSRGADEAILVGPEGEIWEAGTSAVVAAFDRRLVSPPASVGILDSISVAHLFRAAATAGWEPARESLRVDDLFAADGVWLVSSLRATRVHTLDSKSLPPALAHDELVALAFAW
jgi:4-amino-4-deoxychorismate lyase